MSLIQKAWKLAESCSKEICSHVLIWICWLRRQIHVLFLISKRLWESARLVIVHANDTDAVIYLLYYIHYFINLGIKDLWIKFKIGDKLRDIPVHQWGVVLCTQLCKVISNSHVLIMNLKRIIWRNEWAVRGIIWESWKISCTSFCWRILSAQVSMN